MANFSKLIVTNKGKELIAKTLANTAVITFTRVSSSGTVYDEDELEALVGLEDIHQTSLISGISLTNNTSVEIQASFANTELTEGYYLRALGLYAEDPDAGEILYGVTAETSGNCYIPAYNGVTSSGIYLQFVTTVGNAENVSLEINPAAIATIKDVQKVEEKLKILDFDDSGEVEGIESFTDFMSSFVKGTNIYQFFSNLKTGLNYVLHAGQLVNSGMCETPGMFPLDAAFGKTLTDQITQLYSEITPIIKTKDDGILTYLVSGMEYTNCIFVKYGPIIFVKLHGTCPYQLGENTYAKITDPAFVPIREITAVAAFASGTAKNGTGLLKIKPDGSINIVATESGLNWIFADIFYCVT